MNVQHVYCEGYQREGFACIAVTITRESFSIYHKSSHSKKILPQTYSSFLHRGHRYANTGSDLTQQDEGGRQEKTIMTYITHIRETGETLSLLQ